MKIDPTHPLAARARPAVITAKKATLRVKLDDGTELEGLTASSFEDPAPLVKIHEGNTPSTEPQGALIFEGAGPRLAAAHFVFPYPPSVNDLYGYRAVKNARGKWIATVYKTAAHREFMGAVCNAVRVAQLRNPLLDLLPFTGDVRFSFKLFRPRAIGDLDNPLKGVWDGLTEAGVWIDDRQVAAFGPSQRFDTDKKNPRIEVTIEAL